MSQLTFYEPFQQSDIDRLTKRACSLNAGLGNPKQITDVIDNTFSKLLMTELDAKYKNDYAVGTYFTIMEPYFYTNTELNTGNILSPTAQKVGVYSPDICKVQGFNNNPGFNGVPIFKIRDQDINNPSFMQEVQNDIINRGGNPNDASNFYSYNITSQQITIFPKNNFHKKRNQVWILIGASRNYMNMIGVGNTIHHAHIWTNIYASSDSTNTKILNMFDTNSITDYNYTYVYHQAWKINQIDSNISMNVSPYYNYPDTHFYQMERGLQDSDVWGLCQTFALTLYIITLRNPQIGYTNIMEQLKSLRFYSLFVVVDGLIESGESLLKLRNNDFTEVATIDVSNDVLSEKQNLAFKTKRRPKQKSPKQIVNRKKTKRSYKRSPKK